MASRSGGTGVLVALVVFVVMTIGLLAISIVLYVGKTDAETKQSEALAELNGYISSEERGRDETQALKGNAGGASLYGYMAEQSAQMGELVLGDRNANVERVRSTLAVGEKETVRDAMRKLSQERDARTQEATTLKGRVNDLNKEIDGLRDQLASAQRASEAAVAEVTKSIASYRQAADGYRGEFDSARAALESTRSELEERFASETAALQQEIDTLRSERSVVDQRLAALQRKVDATSASPANPATLVDARIIDVDLKTNTLFVDIGANKRVVPGMTFEVFDDAPAIAASLDSGARGKASIQVIKVGDTTSTCRVLRGSGGRPIVKDDVIANAVFNPDYKFKFLVHGKFDVNGDGKSTAGEADYIRARVLEWGGEVVEGDTLSGDLDFLVLGTRPTMPAALPSDATEAQTLSYTEQRNARELYEQLFRTASDAKIPVLNASRFELLTGSVNR
ncbi:MAG: hypothetical protein ACKO0W_12630 [Planctomycetota bacterium]